MKKENLSLLLAGGSLFLLWQMWRIQNGAEQRRKIAEGNSEQAKAQAEFDFNNKTTFTDKQAQEFANGLGELLQYGIGNNLPELEAILMRMKNNADVKKVFALYGKKMTYLYGKPTGLKTLWQTLAIETPEKKNKINIDWKQKGIAYKI